MINANGRFVFYPDMFQLICTFLHVLTRLGVRGARNVPSGADIREGWDCGQSREDRRGRTGWVVGGGGGGQ